MVKNQKLTVSLLVYTLVFFCIWSMFELKIRHQFGLWIPNEYLLQFLMSGILKNLIWTFPAFVLAGHYSHEMYIKPKEMFIIRGSLLKYVPIFILFLFYVLIGAWLQKGNLSLSDTWNGTKIIIVLFVGITEEMVFRGWLLNSTLGDHKWAAVLLNAVLFLLIHFPGWIAEGTFLANFMNLSFLGVFVLSIVFSWCFIKSKNMMIPISLHMFYDLLVFLFL